MQGWNKIPWLAQGQPQPPWISVCSIESGSWSWRAPVKTSHIFLCGVWASKSPLCNYLLSLRWNGQDLLFSLCGNSLLPADSPSCLLPPIAPRLSREWIPVPERGKQEVSRWWLWITRNTVFPFGAPHLNVVRLALPPSFLCNLKPLCSAEGYLFLPFLMGSYPTISPDQLLLCCSD